MNKITKNFLKENKKPSTKQVPGGICDSPGKWQQFCMS